MTLLLFSGCRKNVPETTTEPTLATQPTNSSSQAPTEPSGENGKLNTSAQLLSRIWDQYAEDERFAVYGGTIEHAVNDAPGNLDLNNTEELTTKYLIPADRVSAVTEGGSLVHLMNNNIFTAASFRLAEGTDVAAFAKALRDNLQQNQWICGSPDKILIATPEQGQLLMVFGSSDAMELFDAKLQAVFPQVTVHYQESIVS
jgi:hypothetical protein